ncbi:helix-turn-helix transcriptional regulator [Proteobacteria bacterium 005FR1]|nr:helix-turn-helix transcriptional regulator [Proteobacteria bacterium 005FR1]
MLVNQDRVFYLGLLGAPARRNFGAFTVYTALDSPFRIAIEDGPWETRRLSLVPPYTSHRIQTDDRLIGSIVIESESIEALPAGLIAGENDALVRIRAGFGYLQQVGGEGLPEGLDPDLLFFGETLARRTLDPRVAAVVARIKADPACHCTAEECAEASGLSFSRFLHLFKDEVAVTFRRFRAWKRARLFLHHVNRQSSLTDIALEAGYPDSTYFSHSIRQVYGLRPKDIFAGSRRLAVLLPDGE